MVLAGTFVVVFVAGWLMFQHIPAWYAPPAVGPEAEDAVFNDWLGTMDVLTGQLINSPGPFEHRFTQRQINEWIAIREAKWPDARNWLPPGVTDPFVTIGPEGIRLAATVQKGRLRTVASVRLSLAVGQGGIKLALRDVDVGSLSVPKAFIDKYLDQISAELESEDWCTGDLRRGFLLENRHVWPNGKKPFRITGLRFEPGACVVRFEPLEGGDHHVNR